jgi:hypothetical protein
MAKVPPRLFEELKKYDDGNLWSFLNWIRPSYELGISELPRRTLYHYTDVNGLSGILAANSLRASAASYLNDSSEIEYGCRILVSVLDHWVELNKGRNTFAVQVLNALLRMFKAPVSKFSRRSDIFVTCFCEEDNLLSQWRAYGAKGGYSLGFEVEGLRKGMLAPAPYNSPRLVKVVYQENVQVARIESVLAQSMTEVERTFQAKPVSTPAVNGFFADVTLAIEELLLDEVAAFKHPAFLDEREWRLIARLDLRPELSSTVPPEDVIHQFRLAGGYVVPFIELKPREGKIPLTSVGFGPSLDFKRYQDPVRQLLAVKGFSDDIQLTGSDLPVIL